jgi:calmodulin
MENLTETQLEEFRESFNVFDRDGDGFISIVELELAMRAMGHNPTRIELEEMIEEVDLDKDGAISFEEFVTMMLKTVTDIDIQEKAIEAFKVFDRDGSGVIRVSELKKIMMNLGDPIDEDEADDLIKLAAQEDGFIDYMKFVKSIFTSI